MRSLSILLVALIAFCASPSVDARDSKEIRNKIAEAYVSCLFNEASHVTSRAPKTKPNEFERIATTLCREPEELLRNILQLDVIEAQTKTQRFLNKEEQQLATENIETTIRNMRREVVVLYAQKFDERYPGLRSCTVAADDSTAGQFSYLCAIRD
ncbi:MULTISPECIES: hypothetical protein [unclassified Bradyrhizobium]|uniref:hypothetical protein n=1 Tax=unclassified Bradyrhizobium TaxID=2631580 RepID=UPI0028E8336A|nr:MULTISPECIES: hypothetical protein [unclassified Bradyrhizobium]